MTTMQEVIDVARNDIGDDDKDRHSDAVLLGYANSYIQEAIKYRPDLFFKDGYMLPSPLLSLSDAFPMPNTYIRSCADYVIARVHLRSAEDVNPAVVSAFMNMSTTAGGMQ